jgi:tyrosine-protein kinase Etk/Wzc
MTNSNMLTDHLDDTGRNTAAAGFSIRRLILLLDRKRNVLGIFTLAAGVLGGGIAFLIPSYYRATTTLMPPQQNHSLANALLSQLGGLPTMMASEAGIKDPNDVFIAILQSRSIADSLIGQYDLKAVYRQQRPEDLRESLSRATKIRSEKGGTIVVSVEDKDAGRAAALANSYVSEMYKLNSHMAMTEGAQRRVFFEQQMKAARDELQKSEAEFKKVQESSGIVQLDTQAKGIVEDAFAVQAQVAAQEVQIRSLQPYLTAQNVELKRAQSELAALREQLAKLENHPRVNKMDVPASQLPSAAMEYANRQRDVKYNEAVFEAIGKQFEIARLDEAKDAPLLQVIDSAVPPTRRSGPNRIAIVVVSMLSAFVLALGCILTQDSYRSNPVGWTMLRELLAQD